MADERLGVSLYQISGVCCTQIDPVVIINSSKKDGFSLMGHYIAYTREQTQRGIFIATGLLDSAIGIAELSTFVLAASPLTLALIPPYR
jgi:hypothetical protein